MVQSSSWVNFRYLECGLGISATYGGSGWSHYFTVSWPKISTSPPFHLIFELFYPFDFHPAACNFVIVLSLELSPRHPCYSSQFTTTVQLQSKLCLSTHSASVDTVLCFDKHSFATTVSSEPEYLWVSWSMCLPLMKFCVWHDCFSDLSLAFPWMMVVKKITAPVTALAPELSRLYI
jgi:hypothetical protein